MTDRKNKELVRIQIEIPERHKLTTEHEFGPKTIVQLIKIVQGILPTTSGWLNGASVPVWVPKSSGLHTPKAERAEYLKFLPSHLSADLLVSDIRVRMAAFMWVTRKWTICDILPEGRTGDASDWNNVIPVHPMLVVEHWPSGASPIWDNYGKLDRDAHRAVRQGKRSKLEFAKHLSALKPIMQQNLTLFALVTPEALAKAFPTVKAGAPVKFHKEAMLEAVIAKYGQRRVTQAEALQVWADMEPPLKPSARTISNILSEHPCNNPKK
jgi:hypothetical protein